jgi:hypothetical protein
VAEATGPTTEPAAQDDADAHVPSPGAERPRGVRALWARWHTNAFVLGAEAWAVRFGFGLFVALVATHAFGRPSSYALGVARGTTSIPDSLLHWDAIQYLFIAEHGYTQTAYTAYFPLFPMLIRGVHTVSGLNFDASSLAVAWAAFGALSVAIVYLTRTVLELERWYWPVQLLLWAPASVFFLAGYPEGTEALLFVLLMIFLAKNRLLPAAAIAALASASAPIGVFYGVAVVIRAVQLHAGEIKRAAVAARAIALALVSELGLIGFSLYLWAEKGHPFDYVSAQSLPEWNRKLTWPFHGLVFSIQRITNGRSITSWTTIITYLIDDVATIAAVALALALVVGLWRQRAWRGALVGPAAAAIVALAFNVTDASSGGLSPEALARHVLVLVPLYLAAASTRRMDRLALALAGSAVLATAAASIFSYGGWFT